MFETINKTLTTSMQNIEKEQLVSIQEKIQETFQSIKNDTKGNSTPSLGERIIALEQAIADLALLFTMNN